MFENARDASPEGAFEPDHFRTIFGDRPSIKDAIALGDRADDERVLPDESVDEGEIHWAAGARDGVYTHMGVADDTADRIQSLRAMIDRVALYRRVDDLRTLYAYIVEHGVISVADALADSFNTVPPRNPDAYARLARSLILHAPDREPVKLGITLLGQFGNASDHGDLITLGSHDEFTLFALVALAQLGVDDAPWILAPKVHGWGRIHCIECLDVPVEDAARRRWLLTEGWRNTIMTEYTAAICGRRGGLEDALAHAFAQTCGGLDQVDGDAGSNAEAGATPGAATTAGNEITIDETIDAASNILAALCRSGGPGEDFRACQKCVMCSQRLFALVEQHPSPKLEWYISLRDIAGFARRVQSFPPRDAGVARDLGWTPQVCRALIRGVERIASREDWRNRVQAALAVRVSPGNEHAFRVAADVAEDFKIDPFDARFDRTSRGEDHWYWLARTPDRARFERVLNLARASINLGAIASGPSDCSGFGPAFAAHRTLDWILQELRRWPGVGSDFIRAGLMSPVVRNRIGAARALLTLHPAGREPFLVDVAKARALDPDEAAAELLDKVLSGDREVQQPD